MYTIEEFDKQKSKVMNYILYKKRTEQEVKNKFQNTIQSELLYDIIEHIKEAGYLDDSDYIKKAVSEFMALKNLSIKELTYKLYAKGVDKNKLEDYIGAHKEELEEYEKESAKNICRKKSSVLERDELKAYLMKKGYKQDIIKEVVECKTY